MRRSCFMRVRGTPSASAESRAASSSLRIMSTPVTSRPRAASSTEIRPSPQPASRTFAPSPRPAMSFTYWATAGASAQRASSNIIGAYCVQNFSDSNQSINHHPKEIPRSSRGMTLLSLSDLIGQSISRLRKSCRRHRLRQEPG